MRHLPSPPNRNARDDFQLPQLPRLLTWTLLRPPATHRDVTRGSLAEPSTPTPAAQPTTTAAANPRRGDTTPDTTSGVGEHARRPTLRDRPAAVDDDDDKG
ncbi:hypothetical protein RJ55_03690 [Drechmeria coniospora]|nr:hypothetical protein RJ55_03690 [Drechmeria coniospora]